MGRYVKSQRRGLFYERYFICLSPVVTSIFLLDSFALVALLPRLGPLARSRQRALAAGLACALLGIGTIATRAPDLAGRVAELITPYRGPLDFVIPHLREIHAHPREMVIATNYSAHTFMYYLESHVIVGMSRNNIHNDRQLDPDVVVPRRHWPRALPDLKRFINRGEYRVEIFPVNDTNFNNIPALSLTPWILDRHRFRTPFSDDPKEQLRIYLRIGRPCLSAPASSPAPAPTPG